MAAQMNRLGLLFDLVALSGDIKIEVAGADLDDRLQEAVLISLFTWRQPEASDPVEGDDRKGWWGDTFPAVPGDKIGSRLYLLARRKIVPETLADAKLYTEEALSWLVVDGWVRAVAVTVDRFGIEGIAIGVVITLRDGSVSNLDFAFPWEVLNG
jgi:phage gp46-like protein